VFLLEEKNPTGIFIFENTIKQNFPSTFKDPSEVRQQHCTTCFSTLKPLNHFIFIT